MSWNIVNLFISSTFFDMHAERDYIRKFVIPRLNVELHQYRTEVIVTDLRWGIDTHTIDEDKRESKILYVCVDAIKRTRPYFIALLGERYGWVPSMNRLEGIYNYIHATDSQKLWGNHQTRSVTELEILLGALADKKLLKHSFFCFRSKQSYAMMSENDKKDYFESDLASVSKLEKLKNVIKKTCTEDNSASVVYYNAKWNPQTKKMEELKEFGDQLYNLLRDDIILQVGNIYKTNVSVDSEQVIQDSFVDYNNKSFVGRRKELANLVAFFTDSRNSHSQLNEKKGLVIKAESGYGKSFLYSALCTKLKEMEETSSFIVLNHAVGITPESMQVSSVISRWSCKMAHILGDDAIDIKNVSEKAFAHLILRVQTAGHVPIILVDSIDGLLQNQITALINFIPVNVPFVITTLPAAIRTLSVRSELFKVVDLQPFEREDAISMINMILSPTFKQLPKDSVDMLLSVKNADMVCAYKSPLWLKMALSILAELGNEDFRNIHNCLTLREDEKIDIYLKQIIASFPSEVDMMFDYFLVQTCKFFSSSLTKKTLAIIAISQFGTNEKQLETLIGSDWDSLEFTSLCHWLQGVIFKNAKNQKWNFSHQIFRKYVIYDTSSDLEDLKKSYIELLIDECENDISDIDELIAQAIFMYDYEILHWILDKKSYSKNVRSLFYERVIQCPEETLAFIDGYLCLYYKESLYVATKSWIDLLADRLSRTKDCEDFAKLIYEMLVGHFTKIDLYEGDEVLLETYFEYVSLLLQFLDINDHDEEFSEVIEKVKNVYLYNKRQRKQVILTPSLNSSFFSNWRCYVGGLCRIAERNEQYFLKYRQELYQYLGELEWFVSNVPDNSDLFDLYDSCLSLIRELPFEEKQEVVVHLHTEYYKLYSADLDDVSKNKYVATARTLITALLDVVDEESKISSPLIKMFPEITKEEMEFAKERNQKQQEYIDGIMDETDNECSVGIFSGDDSQSDFEECSFDFDYVEETKLQFRGNESEENDFSSENSFELLYELVRDYSASDILDEENVELRKKYFSLNQNVANYYIQSGMREKAFNQLANAIDMLLLEISAIGNNFVLDESLANSIINISNWYAKNDGQAEQIKLLESALKALWQSLYHHVESFVRSILVAHLAEVYDKAGFNFKKLILYSDEFELVSRCHIERCFEFYECRYRDLSYVRPVYKKLFSFQKQMGLIEEAVVTLEKWANLCETTYIDETDTGFGYDDYDSLYETLAQVYDGTPRITKGMRDRHSVFLKNRFILVCLDGKWGFIDHDGNVVIDCIYDWAWPMMDADTVSVCKDGKWGYLYTDGEQLTDFLFDAAIPFIDGVARIRANDNWALLSKEGLHPIPFDIQNYHFLHDGLQKITVINPFCEKEWQKVRRDYLTVDASDLLLKGRMFEAYSVNEGAIVASYYDENEEPRFGIYNTKGETIVENFDSIVPFGKQNCTLARKGDRYGFIFRDAKIAIPFVFHYARPFCCGIAAVSSIETDSNLIWGFINENGVAVLPQKFYDVGDFHEDMAWVCYGQKGARFGFRGCKYGFVNTEGEMVLPMEFDDVSSFWNGKALVWKENKCYYINYDGVIIQEVLDFDSKD